MSDRYGRRGPGGGRGGFGGRGERGRFGEGGRGPHGGRGRGEGRGRGRGDFRVENEDAARQTLAEIATFFLNQESRISANVDAPEAPQYQRQQDGTVARVGTAVTVGANYFRLQCGLRKAYQYDVSIGCDFSEQLERTIVQKLAEDEQWGNNWIFDGRKTLFATTQFMEPEERVVEVAYQQGGRDRKFNVTITFTNEVSMDALESYSRGEQNVYPADAVRVLEVLLSCVAARDPDKLLHRKNIFINKPDKIHNIQHGANAWVGYHQSVRPCQNGLHLNMDTACGAFYKSIHVDQFIAEILDIGHGRPPQTLRQHQVSKISRTMKNLIVLVGCGERKDKKKVVGLTRKPAECMFQRNGQEMSVLDYYRSGGRQINHPEWPCLDCSKGKKLCYVPFEYATIAPGQFVKHITERNQEQMIRIAAKPPGDKERELAHLIQTDAKIVPDETINQFRLSGDAAPRMLDVSGRILPPPYLSYKNPKCFYVGTDGQWNLGTMPVNFFKGKKLRSWALVSLSSENEIMIPGENGIEAFMTELSQALASYAVSQSVLSPPPIVYSNQNSLVQDIHAAVERAKEVYSRDPDIILCLIPTRNTSLYRALKRASDITVGIPTQCFAGNKSGVGDSRPPRGRQQYCANLALKINVKVGGSNSALLGSPGNRLPMVHQRSPYIVLGCDVSHPSPGSTIPSIAAVVGSVDPMATRYSSRVSHQQSREEIIAAMKESVKGLLLDFYEHNHQKRPESIIVFRDGVSEGFFSKVLLHEYKAIREACLEMGDPAAEYSPPITYIMVQKRHHTRLFPRNPETRHRSGNVKPGTVVDSGITSPFGHDFFLCAQAGIQGTVRPAHYHVLVDENNFGPDAIQVMCYWMCYMQCRCTKSISVPAPANYAHLAALRARLIAGEETDDDTSSVGSGGGGGGSSSHLRGGQSFAVSQNKMYYV